jgi:exonuclease V gamma subunit
MQTLFTITQIKDYGLIHGNVDETQLSAIIKRSEDTAVQSVLGTAFYKDLLTKANNNTLSSDETTLMNEYILPFLASVVDKAALYALNYELRSQGFGVSSDTTFRPASVQELEKMEAELNGYIETYRSVMVNYLCVNKSKFPKYIDNNSDGIDKSDEPSIPISFL